VSDTSTPHPHEPGTSGQSTGSPAGSGGPALTPPPAGAPVPPPAGYGPPAGYAAPPAASGYTPPSYPPPAYGAPAGQAQHAPGYAPPPAAYGAPGTPMGYAGYTTVRTNPLAIASLISSLVGVVMSWTWVLAIGVLVGVVLGHIALSQIRRTGERGRGMALAGVIIGWVAIGLTVLLILAFVLFLTTGALGVYASA